MEDNFYWTLSNCLMVSAFSAKSLLAGFSKLTVNLAYEHTCKYLQRENESQCYVWHVVSARNIRNIKSFLFKYKFAVYNWHGCHRSGNGKKIFFKVRENSGNFTSSQGKLKSLKEVRNKGNFKSTFVHFTDVNRVELVEYCWSLFVKLKNKLILGFQENQSFFCTWFAESINK